MPSWIPGPDGVPVYTADDGSQASPFAGNTLGMSPEALFALQGFTPDQPSALPADEASPLPPAPPPVLAPPPTLSAVSQSTRGFSEGQHAKVERASRGLDGQMARAEAPAHAAAESQAKGAAAAAQQQADAISAQTQVEIDRAETDSNEQLLLQGIKGSFAIAEDAAQRTARAESAQYRARYEAALQEQLAAGGINPSAIFEGEGGKSFSFVSVVGGALAGYLSAKGVRNDFQEQLSRSIDRNIDMQRENLNRKGKATEGFRALWDMQRAESETDAEARLRLRGLILASAEQGIKAELSKYDSKLVATKGQALIADANKELNDTFTKIYQTGEENAQRRAQQAISVWSTKVNASIASASQKLEREKFEHAKNNQGPGEDKINPMVVVDGTSGAVLGVARTDKGAEAARNRMEGVTAMNGLARRYMEAMRKTGPITSFVHKAPNLLTPNERVVMSHREDLAVAIAKANNPDGRISDADREIGQARAKMDTTFTRGGTDKEIASLIENQTESLRAGIRSHLMDPNQAELAAARPGATAGAQIAQAAEKDEADITLGDKSQAAPDSVVDRAVKKVISPGSDDYVPAAELSPSVRAAAEQAGVLRTEVQDTGGGDRGRPSASVPDWVGGFERLYDTARRHSDEKQRADAIHELARYANHDPSLPGPEGITITGEQSSTAAYLLLQLTRKE